MVVKKSEFFENLSTAESRFINRIHPVSNQYTGQPFFGEWATPESIRAWAHATDLGIFFGEKEDHLSNPVIVAIMETRCGMTPYKLIAFAEAAWEYYEEKSKQTAVHDQ